MKPAASPTTPPPNAKNVEERSQPISINCENIPSRAERDLAFSPSGKTTNSTWNPADFKLSRRLLPYKLIISF